MCDCYDITYTDLNPTVFFIGKNNNVATNTPHSHDATELIFVISGALQEWIDGSVYEIAAGDVVIVNPKQLHHHIIQPSNDPVILFFAGFNNYHFKGMEPNRFTFPDRKPYLHTEGIVRQDISNLCLRMISERYSNQAGQYFMQKTYLMQLLLMLMRQIVQAPNGNASSYHFETHHKSYVVSEIRQYLTEHYAEKISLDLIAKNMYLSSAYISKIFKEETGEAPINFLIKLRLEQAREQLEANNRKSIKAISTSVGYEDVYYFSKLFKKYYGVSPLNYRATHRNPDVKTSPCGPDPV